MGLASKLAASQNQAGVGAGAASGAAPSQQAPQQQQYGQQQQQYGAPQQQFPTPQTYGAPQQQQYAPPPGAPPVPGSRWVIFRLTLWFLLIIFTAQAWRSSFARAVPSSPWRSFFPVWPDTWSASISIRSAGWAVRSTSLSIWPATWSIRSASFSVRPAAGTTAGPIRSSSFPTVWSTASSLRRTWCWCSCASFWTCQCQQYQPSIFAESLATVCSGREWLILCPWPNIYNQP